jgi:hypothetical protein
VTHLFAWLLAGIVFVPLDDRPVSLQLPLMLGRIAGVSIQSPPRELVGRYVRFGQPDPIVSWLNAAAPPADAYVISNDMLAQGGLVASRVPGTTYADAYFRMREYGTLRARSPRAWIAAFGTITRLAPTGVPAIGDAANFFAAYPAWTYLQAYANLHDPLLPAEEAQAKTLRAQVGDATLQAYLDVRARNVAIDRLLIGYTARIVIDRLVLGQDDAKTYGLHIPEIALLRSDIETAGVSDRATIEPGADELGMAMVAHAIARKARWKPRIAVRYSTPDGAGYQDPLEFTPLDTTVDALIDLCGGVRVDDQPDLALYVVVPKSEAYYTRFIADIQAAEAASVPVAVADLSYEESYAAQDAFVTQILDLSVATKLDAYAGWNTAANTVGTALAEAIAAGAGRRMHSYDSLAHRTFTFLRFVDDVDFHIGVRPMLNQWLDSIGITDHTYLLPDIATQATARNESWLWPRAQSMLQQLDPGYHIAAMQITLPWNRTFETEIDAALAPNL